MSVDYLLTGEVGAKDMMMIDERVRELDSDDYFHYKEISDHFLVVVLKHLQFFLCFSLRSC